MSRFFHSREDAKQTESQESNNQGGSTVQPKKYISNFFLKKNPTMSGSRKQHMVMTLSVGRPHQISNLIPHDMAIIFSVRVKTDALLQVVGNYR